MTSDDKCPRCGGKIAVEQEEPRRLYCTMCGRTIAWLRPAPVVPSGIVRLKIGVEQRRQEQQRVGGALPPRPCEICGQSYTPKSAVAKYCSGPCRKEAHFRARRLQPRPVRVCRQCGVEFAPLGSYLRWYCSEDCRMEGRKLEARNCGHCGKQYQPNHGASLYCSASCAAKEGYERAKRQRRDREAVMVEAQENFGDNMEKTP